MILLYSRNYMYEAGIRANYHESSDCFNFEYPPKSLLTHQATQKKIAKILLPEKVPK